MIKLPPDITFLIQLVSFLVFWQLMKVLLFNPVQHALHERNARTAGAQQTAEKLRSEGSALRAQLDAALQAARAEGMHGADEIRRRAEIEEQAILGRYQDEANTLLERERAETARQVAAARAPLRAEAERLAEAVVVKVLGRAA
jgi:F0F1-type ATP synthase membrane subunit b/b'